MHSHAFQYALRARAQRFPNGEGSFWSWRKAMYDLVLSLDPDSMYRIAKNAYVALRRHGVRCVGEFHYVHHAPGGVPYQDPDAMAHAVIQAAIDANMRISLLRSVYQRPGFDRVLEDGQKRFLDNSADDAVASVERLATHYRNNDHVNVELAPHSLRACSRETLRDIVSYAKSKHHKVHMHVSEQPREVDECLAEYGLRPVELLRELGALDENFTAVHSTHLSHSEIAILRETFVTLCFSRSTERDLADGAPKLSALFGSKKSQLRLAFGVDGYAELDPFLEARSLEFDERTRTGERPAVFEAPRLLQALTYDGYECLGFSRAQCDEDALRVQCVEHAHMADALIFATADVHIEGVSRSDA